VEKINEPRYPTFKGIMAAKKKPVQTLTLADLSLDAGSVGLANAASWVEDFAKRPPRAAGVVVKDEGDGGTKTAAFLADRGTRKPSAHTIKAYCQDFGAIATLVAGEAAVVARMSLADITTDSMRTAFGQDGLAECLARSQGGSCPAAIMAFTNRFGSEVNIAFWSVTLIVPGLIGVLVGAPLIARELEYGTWRLAWSQTIPRTRWLAVKLALVTGGLIVLGAAVFLHERLNWRGWTGVALTCIGVLLVSAS